jgi:hypothetical protein
MFYVLSFILGLIGCYKSLILINKFIRFEFNSKITKILY